MKKNKKVMSLLLVAALCLGLTACGGSKESGNTGTSASKESTTSTTATTGTSEAATGSESTSTEAEPTGATMGKQPIPVTDEKVELSMWVVWSNNNYEDPGQAPAIQKLEELTNVHIRYIPIGNNEASEKFGLMLASGDIPDMVRQAKNYYPGGMAKAIEDGVFMDLTDYVPQYMPNYLDMVASNAEAQKGYKSDDGRNLLIYNLNGNDNEIASELPYLGIMIRKDWLDDCGLEVPETVDEWHTVLTAFKNEKGAEAPLMIGPAGTMYASSFASAYGVMTEFYAEDGKVKYGPAEEGYKKYLETFRQWYAEGLIDQNFTANNSLVLADNSYLATGKSGAGNSLITFAGDYYRATGMSDDPNIFYTGAPTPVLNKGDKPQNTYDGSRITGEGMAISATCKNVETALRWLDTQFTEEGMLLNVYGLEGVSYTRNDGGTPKYKYTDQIMNNPDGYSPADALALITPRIPAGYYSWQYSEQFKDESIIDVKKTWAKASRDMLIAPEVTMTDEEGNKYNSLYTNIKTLVDEMTVKYIIGYESLDNYDSFVETLYQYGLQDCIDVKQAAYDRYVAR